MTDQPPPPWQPPSWPPQHPGLPPYPGTPQQQPGQPVRPFYAYAPQPNQPASPGARAFPHPEPTPYHSMLRTWSYATWKPIVGVIIVVVAFFVVTALVYIVVAGIAAIFQDGSWIDNFIDSGDIKKNVSASTLLGLNLGLGSLILVTWFVIRVVHGMRPRWLTSVVPRMRWKFFLVCLGLAAVALLAQIVVGSALPGGNGAGVEGKVNDFTTSTALAAIVVLLTTPLQAAGEEFVFRGYLLQAFGSLSRNKWVAIVGTALLFALAHGTQNFPLFFDRLAFGLIAGWLVCRTGGLEAGIALHVLNNFLAFGLALSFGDLSSTLNVTEASWWNIVLTVTQSGVYVGLVLLVARKMDLQTLTRPPASQPSGAPTGTVGGDLATA
ncbi:MAG: CPBP family glutamic-type intramembrane protease [Nocardioidaceae bacterium]